MALARTLVWTILMTTSLFAGPGGPGQSLAAALVRGTLGTSSRALSIMIEWARGRAARNDRPARQG